MFPQISMKISLSESTPDRIIKISRADVNGFIRFRRKKDSTLHGTQIAEITGKELIVSNTHAWLKGFALISIQYESQLITPLTNVAFRVLLVALMSRGL